MTLFFSVKTSLRRIGLASRIGSRYSGEKVGEIADARENREDNARGKRGRTTKQRGNIAIYPRTRLIYNDAYSRATARRLGASHLYVLSLICATRNPPKRRGRGKKNEWRRKRRTGES